MEVRKIDVEDKITGRKYLKSDKVERERKRR